MLQPALYASLIGTDVFMAVGVRARVGGRDGAWLSYFAVKDSVIQSQVPLKK